MPIRNLNRQSGIGTARWGDKTLGITNRAICNRMMANENP